MLPIAMLVMAAMMLPSAGSWGPREGVTAWAFVAAGLGARHGVATAVVFGVMVLVASLPGAVVLVIAWLRRTPSPQLGRRFESEQQRPVGTDHRSGPSRRFGRAQRTPDHPSTLSSSGMSIDGELD
jgi:hypothetical protein